MTKPMDQAAEIKRLTDERDDLLNTALHNADDLRAMTAEIKRLRDALEVLAKLGNGDHYGNSGGNRIAQAALKEQDND